MLEKLCLTSAQATILAAAQARRNGSVTPLPEGFDTAKQKTQKVLKQLLANQLIEERTTRSANCAWRTDEAGRHYALRITEAGRGALDAEPTVANPSEIDEESGHNGDVAAKAPRGKLGAVLAAVREQEGAALDELVVLTGWQKHTVRACITRLRQTGFRIEMATTDRGKRYLAAPEATGAGQ